MTSGGSKTFTITPNTGYRVADVTVDGQSVGAVAGYTFSNVVANHTITATFAANVVTYVITAAVSGAGGVISPSGVSSVTSGGSKTFTITPNTGYRVADVTVDGQSVGAVAGYTFSNVVANHTITATFVTNNVTYVITAAVSGTGGSISPSGSSSVSQGGSKTFTIKPKTGYRIAGVMVDGKSVGAIASYTFRNVTANHTISATFKRWWW